MKITFVRGTRNPKIKHPTPDVWQNAAEMVCTSSSTHRILRLSITESVLARVARKKKKKKKKISQSIYSFQSRITGKNIRNVQESVFIFVLFINAAHECCSWWENLIDEDEDSFLWRKLYTLTNHVYKLSYREVGGNEIFLLVDSSDIWLFDFFTYHL